MIKLSVFIFALFSANFSFAQEQEPSFDIQKNELGAHIGATTGIGFSYRHWFKKAGIQITAIPIKTDDVILNSLGLTALYTLKKTKYLRTYIYLGGHLLCTNYYLTLDSTDERYDDSYEDDYGEFNGKTREYTEEFNIGFGPGISFGNKVAFNIMIGYGMYDITNKFNLLPTGEMGVYYMF